MKERCLRWRWSSPMMREICELRPQSAQSSLAIDDVHFFFIVHWLMSAHFYHVLFIIIGMFTNCYWMLNYELACCCCFECAAFRKFAATCNSVALVCVCICVVVAICTNGHGTKPEFSFTFYWVFSVAAASATTACINNEDNDTTTTTMATINPWFLMCIIVVLQQQLIFSVFFLCYSRCMGHPMNIKPPM